MAKAEALFKRHWKAYCAIDGDEKTGTHNKMELAIIYGFCILAEAIRNEQDEIEIKEPKD